MKKILIPVGVLMTMSFTLNQMINTYQIAEAIDNIQDLQEWMEEDYKQGKLDESIASDYLDVLQETEYRLIEFCESNRITNVRNQDYKVDENGNMSIIQK